MLCLLCDICKTYRNIYFNTCRFCSIHIMLTYNSKLYSSTFYAILSCILQSYCHVVLSKTSICWYPWPFVADLLSKMFTIKLSFMLLSIIPVLYATRPVCVHLLSLFVASLLSKLSIFKSCFMLSVRVTCCCQS
jgi:hypothetical protein